MKLTNRRLLHQSGAGKAGQVSYLTDVAIFIGRKHDRAIMVLDSPKFPWTRDKGMTISIGVQNHYFTSDVCSFGVHCVLQIMPAFLL
jgi:hypothetical protein